MGTVVDNTPPEVLPHGPHGCGNLPSIKEQPPRLQTRSQQNATLASQNAHLPTGTIILPPLTPEPYENHTDPVVEEPLTHEHSRNLRILGLNVCGLISKLNLNVLEDLICDNYDIICFSETKLDRIDEANIKIEGFVPFYHHRPKYKQKSGGIATFVHVNISENVELVKPSENEYVQWLKVNENVLGHEIVIGTVYIPPPDSPFSSGDEFDLILRDLLDIKSSHNSKICLVGDFNSRTGTLPDQLEPDRHLLTATGLEDYRDEIFIDDTFLNNLNIPTTRHNDDKIVDTNGRKMIEFCMDAGMLIVNGRFGKPKVSGRVTCKGSSTVDYAIADTDVLGHINDFCVETFDRCLSDIHCPISLELVGNLPMNVSATIQTHNTLTDHNTQPEKQTANIKVSWDKTKSKEFGETLQISDINNLVAQINTISDQPSIISQGDIDDITNSIKQIYIESGKKVGVINSKPTTHQISRTKAQQRKTNQKPWFDDTCKQSRKDVFLAKNCFKISPNISNKTVMNDESKAYRKTIRSSYNSYHSDLQQKLRELKSSNPKDFWDIINKAEGTKSKIGNISLGSFENHFKNLNDDDTEPTDELSQGDNSTANDLPFNQPISEAEIHRTIKRLQNGKAGGTDNIINEFLKNSPKEMIRLICSYFNLILNTGTVPDTWTIGLIVPIYKNKGDIHDPDNYRGITLLSCIGKLFTMVINSRLSIYLNENDLLGEE